MQVNSHPFIIIINYFFFIHFKGVVSTPSKSINYSLNLKENKSFPLHILLLTI